MFLCTLYLTPHLCPCSYLFLKIWVLFHISYVGAWVGQAMIAEAIGDPEAMDLFRVTVSMENNTVHSQGLIGYGHWVCKMLVRRAKGKR